MEFNYQKKRKHTIGKLIVMSLATLLPIIAYFVLGAIYRFFNSPEKMDLVVLRLLVLIIFELAIAFKIVLYIRIIASEEFANKYFIKKNDERNIYIRQRTTSFTMKLSLYLMGVGMVVAGFYSKAIFYVLGAIIICEIIIYIFTHLYFSKKY